MKIQPEFNIESTDLIGFLTKILKEISYGAKDILRLGLDEYLRSQIDKYYYTNTFINRQVKVPFYDVYYPISIEYEEKKYYFNNPIREMGANHNIAVIGSAGSGKSMLTKHIFLQCIKHSLKIPLIIELRNLNTSNDDFETFVFKRLSDKNIKPTEDLLIMSMKSGNHLFILDGYDELYSEKIEQINLQIEDFVDKYRKNYFILTSRPNAGAEQMPRFKSYFFSGLIKSEVVEFIYKIVPEFERQQRIANVIRKPESEDYFQYLKNPLLLSMFILTFESYPELPKSKAQFYRNVFETLYSRHDGVLKNSFERQRASGLKKDEFEKIINTFSYIAFANGMYSFDEFGFCELLKKIKPILQINYDEQKLMQDLITTTSLLIRDGIKIQYPHRSLQEYFSACFIKDLTDQKHKETVYENLSQLVSTNTNDNYSNFWNLCEEMEPQGFYRYFVIKILREFQKKIFSTKASEVLIALSDIYGIEISVTFDKKVVYQSQFEKKGQSGLGLSKGVFLICYSPKSNYYSSVLTYLDLNLLFEPFGKLFSFPTFLNSLKNGLAKHFPTLHAENIEMPKNPSRYLIDELNSLDSDDDRELKRHKGISFIEFINKYPFLKINLEQYLFDYNIKNRITKLSEIISDKILELESKLVDNEMMTHTLINLQGLKKLVK